MILAKEKNQNELLPLSNSGDSKVCNAPVVGVAGAYFPWIFPAIPGSDNNTKVPFTTIAVID
jgi:hypothetical protein